jgi:hypothetical protein
MIEPLSAVNQAPFDRNERDLADADLAHGVDVDMVADVSKPSSSTREPLTCIAIILCEDAYKVEGRSNLIIVNTFHTLGVPKCPCRFPKITVLYTVNNGRGKYEVRLCIVHAGSGETILEAPDVIQMDSPLTIGDTQAVLRDVPLPAPGKCWAEIRANGELIGQRPFYVNLMRRQGNRPAGNTA